MSLGVACSSGSPSRQCSFVVSLVVVGWLPGYRRIAAEATQMRAAGGSVKAISLYFGVDHHIVEKAIRWFRQRVR